MKPTLLLSVAFLESSDIFAANIKDSLDVNYLIFMSLLVILMLICIVISILIFNNYKK
jgi:hypothetical protein